MRELKNLKSEMIEFLNKMNLPEQVRLDGDLTIRLRSRDEITIDGIDQLLPQGVDDVKNVLIGAETDDHEYVLIDFFDASQYVGRGFVVDDILKAYQLPDQDWIDLARDESND
ncbi:hypothetical protein BKY29_07320 [Weissella confusa]|uniref:hypothetical protein n=1 Tax=Weissella confusa TaxID=1583 RepID=UPI0008FDB9AB|nr:hypothetical protein [Weissella confusa]OJF03303.1 hypothetical protein BKY29_07320 [Weissella confusa]